MTPANRRVFLRTLGGAVRALSQNSCGSSIEGSRVTGSGSLRQQASRIRNCNGFNHLPPPGVHRFYLKFPSATASNVIAFSRSSRPRSGSVGANVPFRRKAYPGYVLYPFDDLGQKAAGSESPSMIFRPARSRWTIAPGELGRAPDLVRPRRPERRRKGVRYGQKKKIPHFEG